MGLINRVVPRERLDDEVNELAFHVAQAPLTTLMAAKANIRRAWDLMGIRTHLQQSNDLLTVATQATDVKEYIRDVFQAGLRPRDAAQRNAERAKVLAAESKARLDGPSRTDSAGPVTGSGSVSAEGREAEADCGWRPGPRPPAGWRRWWPRTPCARRSR